MTKTQRLLCGLLAGAAMLASAAPARADTAPTVAVHQPEHVTATSAQLTGEVNPENGPSETEWHFEYSTGDATWTRVPRVLPGEGRLSGADEENHFVQEELTGLNPGSTYYVRLVASNEGGSNRTASAGPDPSFTTPHGVVWRLNPLASTTIPAGGTLEYHVQITNIGDDESSPETNPMIFIATAPSGLTFSSVETVVGSGWSCSGIGTAVLECENSTQHLSPLAFDTLAIELAVAPGLADGTVLTSHFSFRGGEPAATATSVVDPTTVAATPPPFGFDAFDLEATANSAGEAFTTAAGHPYGLDTYIDFNTETNTSTKSKGSAWPVAPERDIVVDLPPGLLGNLDGLPQCTLEQLIHSVSISPQPECPVGSQVGSSLIRLNKGDVQHGGGSATTFGQWLPVYDMVPPPGAIARFALNVADVIVNLDVHVRNGGDYGVSVDTENIPEGLAIAGTTVSFWGVPSDAAHTLERHCPGRGSPESVAPPGCASDAPAPVPLLRLPSACTPSGHGLATVARMDSWVDPGAFVEKTSVSHKAPGAPFSVSEWGEEVGPEGCAAVPFKPSLSVQATSETADSPTGLDVHIDVPQDCWDNANEVCSSDLKDAEVTLPRGMTLNPSAATNLEACTPAQIGLTSEPGETPIKFTGEPAHCPEASKIGSVHITTPLLEEELTGSVYLAKQGDNPFDSLLAMYLVAENAERGIVVKQAGEITSDPQTGRLTTVFKETPQTPFSDLHVSLFGGPRAALRTPPSCGTYAVSAELTPWSGNAPVDLASGFEVESCPNGGFDPKLSAGTQNPLAASFSPFSLRLTREDGSEQIAGLDESLPEGLVGKLAGIPYCPNATLASVSAEVGTGAAQEAHPSCPAASQVGTVTVGAGAGPDPFYTRSGRAYLAGPYKGAPLSLAVVAPAVAGPFDLGSVVVRNAIEVDPTTTQITTVSDPIPTILHGIPLDLRDIRVQLDRGEFTLNPTSCEPMAVNATVTSAQGSIATPSQRFQAAGCERLGFKPKLALRFSGQRKRTGDPALHATLKMPAGDANVASARVTLPKGILIDNAHINNPCTRVQYAADQCPPTSILGYARAFSPLLDKPLEGPVYFRSNGGERELPDLVASLDGQIHVELVGFIDAKNERIRNTFAVVPDAPVSRFTLGLFGGKRGLLENGHDLCASKAKALAQFTGHNGKTSARPITVSTPCKRHGGKGRPRHGS